jgi:predicted dehydrogenase
VSEQIRIGIVGCGHIAAAHLNGFKLLKEKGLLDRVIIRALCNRTLWKAESFRQRGEGPEQQPGVGPPGDPMQASPVWVSDFQDEKPEVYSDYREMLSREDINVVFVLSSVSTHHEIASDALERGMNVLIEKPFTISVKAGQRLVETAKRRGLILGVAECVRYSPIVRMIRWCIDEGYLGDIQFTLYLNVGGFWSPDKIVAKTAWRHKKLMAAGGAAVDWLVHIYDWLRYTVGEIDEITGVAPVVEPARFTRNDASKLVEEVASETDDTVSCTIHYRSGAIGNIMISWAGHGEETSVPLTYYGSRGCIKGDQIILDGEKPRSLNEFFSQQATPDVKERFMPRGISDFFALEILAFLDAVRECRPMETSGDEALRDLACCFATLEASNQKQPIRVGDVLSGKVASVEADINRHYGL